MLVITRLGRLQSPTREVGRQRPSDEVGDRLSQAKQVEEDQHGGGRTEAQDTVRLGDVGTGLKLVQEAVLGQLSVQGVELSLRHLLGLLDERVVCGGISKLGNLLTSRGGESSTGLLGVAERFVGLGLDRVGGITGSVGGVGSGVSGLVGSVGSGVPGLIGSVSSGVPGLVGSVRCGISGSVRSVLGLGRRVVGHVGSLVSGVVRSVRGSVGSVVCGATDVVRGVVSLVGRVVYGGTSSVRSIVNGRTGSVGCFLTGLLGSDGRVVTRLVGSLRGVGVGEVVGGVGSSVNGLVSLLRAGVDVGVGLCGHFLEGGEGLDGKEGREGGEGYSR